MQNISTKEEWLAQLDAHGQLNRIFQDLPDILFFIKDEQARNRDCNQAMLKHLGLESQDQLYGKYDYEFLPHYMVEKYKADDVQILQTGSPLIHRVELFPAENNLPNLFITNKYPVFNHQGRVCGICGIIRKMNTPNYTQATHADLAAAVQYISENFTQTISIKNLAKQSKLSIRQFQRKFQQTFQTSPQEYLLKFRLLKAAELLVNTDQRITQIAHESGFYDHSSFTRHFKKYMNQTPSAYRTHAVSSANECQT